MSQERKLYKKIDIKKTITTVSTLVLLAVLSAFAKGGKTSSDFYKSGSQKKTQNKYKYDHKDKNKSKENKYQHKNKEHNGSGSN